VDTVKLLMWGGGLAAGLAFALLPRRVANVVLPSGVALFLVLSSYSVFGAIRDHSRATLAQTGASDPSWIDDEIGSGSNAAFLYGGTADLVSEAQVMWQTEFWNRSVGTVLTLGPPEPAPLPESPATFDAANGRIALGPRSQGIRYMVVPANVQLAGRLLAEQGRLALYRIESPTRLSTLLGGVYADGWMGSDAALTHYAQPSPTMRLRIHVSRERWRRPSAPGQVRIKLGLLGAPNGQPTIRSVTALKTFTIRSGAARSFTLPTPKSPFRLEIHVAPTFSPADYGEADARELGAQVELRLVS
jgi:hypothetical protein